MTTCEGIPVEGIPVMNYVYWEHMRWCQAYYNYQAYQAYQMYQAYQTYMEFQNKKEQEEQNVLKCLEDLSNDYDFYELQDVYFPARVETSLVDKLLEDPKFLDWWYAGAR